MVNKDMNVILRSVLEFSQKVFWPCLLVLVGSVRIYYPPRTLSNSMSLRFMNNNLLSLILSKYNWVSIYLTLSYLSGISLYMYISLHIYYFTLTSCLPYHDIFTNMCFPLLL